MPQAWLLKVCFVPPLKKRLKNPFSATFAKKGEFSTDFTSENEQGSTKPLGSCTFDSRNINPCPKVDNAEKSEVLKCLSLKNVPKRTHFWKKIALIVNLSENVSLAMKTALRILALSVQWQIRAEWIQNAI